MVSQPWYGQAYVAVKEGTYYFKVFFAELVALLHREGKTAYTFLQELYERYVKMWYCFVTLLILCVIRYGYFQVSFLLGRPKLYLQFAFRPTTAILFVMTHLSLTKSLHTLEIMMGRLVFP